ncbi:MAG: PEGA domain-containing protein [Sandaracinaceae bacterium]|nr:PEGA domain-containing protein [Sandaracinaceae bacterium]
MLRALLLAVLLGLVPTATAWAQEATPPVEETIDESSASPPREAPREQIVRVAGSPRFPGRAELWARRVTRALRRGGASVVVPEHLDWDREGIDERRLIQLEEIEAALGVARRAQVQLEEAEAMRALSAASRRARDLLDVPGAAEWLAEVEVVTAIVAAQRGDASLAEASLRRALALAPDRALQEGEAPPELVARSIALMREEVRRARIEVQVEGTAATAHAAAQVFVDDRPLGALPREIEVPAGVHVIRVEARGHRPYARLVDLAPGSRAPMLVALAPSAAALDAAALDEAIARGAHDEVAQALADVVAHGGLARAVWLVQIGTGPLDRAVLVRCAPGSCEAPRRIDDATVLALDSTAPIVPESGDGDALADALAWVDETPIEPPPPPPSIAESWWLWTGVGVVAIGLGVGIALGVTPSGDAPLVLRIDPCTSCAR